MATKQKQDVYLGPVYSAGTEDMDAKNNQGPVAGPTGGLAVPDPLGLGLKPGRGAKKE